MLNHMAVLLECKTKTKTDKPVWTRTASGANKELVLHVQLRWGSLSITTPVSHLNKFNVQSKLLGKWAWQLSIKFVSLWGYERLQNSKDSLKAWFENVDITCTNATVTVSWSEQILPHFCVLIVIKITNFMPMWVEHDKMSHDFQQCGILIWNDSDEPPVQPPFKLRNSKWCSVSNIIFKWLAKAQIRLRICAGWSEPLMVAHTTLLEIPCRSSNVLWTFGFIFEPDYSYRQQGSWEFWCITYSYFCFSESAYNVII